MAGEEELRRTRGGEGEEEDDDDDDSISDSSGGSSSTSSSPSHTVLGQHLSSAGKSGVPRGGVHWKHMGVVNLPSGKPTMALTGGAALRLEALMPEGHEALIHLTITDDNPWASAVVIIEALPVKAAP